MGWCTARRKVLLFYVKTVIKESPCFELAHLKKKQNILAAWRLSFAMLFALLAPLNLCYPPPP